MKLIALAVIVETVYWLIKDYRRIGVPGRRPFPALDRAVSMTSQVVTISVCLAAINVISVVVIVFSLAGIYACVELKDREAGLTDKEFSAVFLLSVLIIVQCIIVIAE